MAADILRLNERTLRVNLVDYVARKGLVVDDVVLLSLAIGCISNNDDGTWVNIDCTEVLSTLA